MKGGFLPDGCSDTHHCTEQFLRLLTANNKKIYAFIFTLAPNYFDADDIMQETVTYMYHHFSDFKEGTDFMAWAARIAYYRVLSFRKKKNDKHIQFNTQLLQLLQVDSKAVLDEMNSRLEALRHCRKKLSQHDKKLIELKYEQGAETKHVAEKLGRSIHSVYRAIARIHDVLLRCVRRTLSEGTI